MVWFCLVLLSIDWDWLGNESIHIGKYDIELGRRANKWILNTETGMQTTWNWRLDRGVKSPVLTWFGKNVAGWWLGHPSEKYEFVNWDDYSQYMGKCQKWEPNHQTGWISYHATTKDFSRFHPLSRLKVFFLDPTLSLGQFQEKAALCFDLRFVRDLVQKSLNTKVSLSRSLAASFNLPYNNVLSQMIHVCTIYLHLGRMFWVIF